MIYGGAKEDYVERERDKKEEVRWQSRSLVLARRGASAGPLGITWGTPGAIAGLADGLEQVRPLRNGAVQRRDRGDLNLLSLQVIVEIVAEGQGHGHHGRRVWSGRREVIPFDEDLFLRQIHEGNILIVVVVLDAVDLE